MFSGKCFREEYLRRLQFLLKTEELTQDIDDKLAMCNVCVQYSKENGLSDKETEMCCYYCVGSCNNPKCLHIYNESYRSNKELRGNSN